MSFMGGAECSTAGNPLSQFTKHVQDDKSLQRDRLVGRAPGGGMQGMRSGMNMSGSQDHMMNDFMQQNGQLPPEAFAMQHDLHQNAQMRNGSQSPAVGGWAQEFNPGMPGMPEQAMMEAAFQAPKGTAFSPADFARFQQMGQSSSARSASPMAQNMSNGYSYQGPQMGMGMGMGMMGMNRMGMGMNMMNQPQYQQPAQDLQQDKGKGKMVELDDQNWEEQFKQIDLQGKELEESLAAEGELNEMDRSVLESETNEFGDFESIWKGIQAENAAAREMAGEQSLNGMNISEFDQWDGFDAVGTHQSPFRDPQLGDYMFENENLFKDISNPFDEGVRIMHEGGNLSLAALAFEAAVQKDPQHVDAWVLLGSAQAQNEKETPAIRALEQALKVDPMNLTALMGLAVSYTNEGYDSTAYRTLERWLSIKYPSIIEPGALSSENDIGFTDRHQLHEKVTDLFIRAAQLSPDGEHMDPDVQVGLGVLFYGAEEYDKAVDCFTAALASTESGTSNQRDQVHLLWNRLGATLANSGRSEEAIAAYEKALTLRINFVRARYNLGVSCINIGCFDEAASHLLGALAMHKIVENEGREKARDVLGGGSVSEADLERMISQNQSTNLYDTLRRVFSQMGRRDLSERVVAGMDVESFRGDFDF
ncbi:putative peroxisomal targeting signal receptor protein [Botrytis fragariae]|uniref:Peroxisomal targeting signal receptor n=1 Tax=Botrytis fragariae TaxID=1964551 RepID=A0A8H6AP26_9HELO|nr:putative peroxisomal targeting signal receptor protein [Botrytis fragariae]KAF5870760.1 putative peroxisomal targeting signal receptor protein [Botrytis fragariae]